MVTNETTRERRLAQLELAKAITCLHKAMGHLNRTIPLWSHPRSWADQAHSQLQTATEWARYANETLAIQAAKERGDA